MNRSLAALFGLSVLLSASAAFAGPFEGRFAGDGVQLVLRETGASASGEAILEGKSHAVRARLQDKSIVGEYEFDGEWVAFSGTIDGSTLVLTSEGETYRLTRAPSSAAAAKPVAAAVAVGGPLQNDGWGIRLKAPPGWTGGQQDGGFAFGSATLKGLIVVFPHDAKTVAELREAAAEGLEPGGGKLALNGEAKAFGGNGLSAGYKGVLDGKPARGHAIGIVNPRGSGAVILALSEEGGFTPEHTKAVEAIARSIEFYKVPVPDEVTSWEKQLSGSRLEYLYFYRGSGGSGSTSQNVRITLCGDRSFWYRGNSHTSIDVGGASGLATNKEGAGGSWSVMVRNGAPMLDLKFADGGTRSYQLAYENKKLYLSQDRYYWSTAPNCR